MIEKKTKIDISWYVAMTYINGLKTNTLNLFGDSEYKKRFDELRSYVEARIEPPNNDVIVDLYLTVEHKPM